MVNGASVLKVTSWPGAGTTIPSCFRAMESIRCGLLSDAPVRNYEIANFVAIIRRIDDPSMANDNRAHVAIPPHKYSTAMRTARPLVT